MYSFSREARLSAPPMQKRRNLENSAVPTLLVREPLWPFMLLCIDPKVIWGLVGNRILTIFDPYTFLHMA